VGGTESDAIAEVPCQEFCSSDLGLGLQLALGFNWESFALAP